MKLIMIDWEVEKDKKLEKIFKDNNFRFQLQEVIEETATRKSSSVLLNTNNFDELKIKIGELMILNPLCLNLEMEINKTLKHHQRLLNKSR